MWERPASSDMRCTFPAPRAGLTCMFASLVQLLWRRADFPRAENLSSSSMRVCCSDLRLTDDDYFYLCDRNLLDVLSRCYWILTSWGGKTQPAHPSVWASASLLSALKFRLSGPIVLIWAVRRCVFMSQAYSSLCRYLYTCFVWRSKFGKKEQQLSQHLIPLSTTPCTRCMKLFLSQKPAWYRSTNFTDSWCLFYNIQGLSEDPV